MVAHRFVAVVGARVLPEAWVEAPPASSEDHFSSSLIMSVPGGGGGGKGCADQIA